MEPEKKRTFNFGTGEIDVDQWLRDIDAGLPDYYERMGKTYHNKENEEVRNAMTDLIGRISSGDMLSRSATGTYNFKSQLYSPNRGKYTKWAYLTALSYIGGKGRGLVQAPVEQKEKVEELAKPKYSAQTLLKRFNNSILRGATTLNLENTWWSTASPELRAQHMSDFLNKEAAYLRGTDVGDVEDMYKDLGKEGLASAMSALATSITSNPTGDFGRQFGNLGLNNLLKRTTKPQDAVKVKTVDEQLKDYLAAEETRLKQIQLGWLQNKGEDSYYNLDSILYQNALKGLTLVHNNRASGEDVKTIAKEREKGNITLFGPDGTLQLVSLNPNIPRSLLFLPQALKDTDVATYNYENHFKTNVNSAKQFLTALQLNWETLFDLENPGLQYKNANGNDTVYTPLKLWEGLALLTHLMKDNQGLIGYTYLDNSRNYPILVGDQLYYIPGTYRQSGNILLMDTYNNRLVKSSIAKYPDLQKSIGTALYEKEGGILKYLNGGSAGDNYSRFGVLPVAPTPAPVQQQTQLSTSQLLNNSNNKALTRPKLTAGDITRLTAMGADIASLATSFGHGKALSKFSRWASVGAGVGNLVGDAMNFGSDAGMRAPAAGLLFGHDIADLGIRVYGATPFGNRGVAMRYVGQNISRNFAQYGRALAPFVLAYLNNADAAKAAMGKITSGRFNELNTDEWMAVATAIEGVLSGKQVQVHTQRARAADRSITHYNVTKPDGTTQTMTKLEYMGDRKAFGALPSNENGRGVPVRTQQGLVDNNKFTVREGYYKWMGPWVQPWALPNRINRTSLEWFNLNTRPEEGYTRKWNPQLNNGEGDFEPTDMSKMIIGPVRNAPQKQSLNVLRELRQGPVDYSSMPERTTLEPEVPLRTPEEPPVVINPTPEPVITEPPVVIPPPVEPPVVPKPEPKGVKKGKRGKKAKRHELGGYFTFLRTGGVVTYATGGKTGVSSGTGYNWYNNVFSGYKLHILDGLATQGYADWLNSMQGDHAKIYNAAGGTTGSWKTTFYEHPDVKSYLTKYLTGFNGYDSNDIYNTSGIGKAYASVGHYDFSDSNNRASAEVNGGRFVGTPDGKYSQITDDRRLLGREGDWTPDQLLEWNTALQAKGYTMDLGPDKYYRINVIDKTKLNPTGNEADPNKEKPQVEVTGDQPVDSIGSSEIEGGGQPGNPKSELKKPYDPRAALILGRGVATLFGNEWLYDRMLDRYPTWVAKDFRDLKLDTVGDYAAIAHAGNQAADLRHIQQLRLGSDQTLNLAADFEAGRIGRETMDKAFLLDAAKLLATHLAAVQVDMLDAIDNRETAWYNRQQLRLYLLDKFDLLNARDKARVDTSLGVVNNLTQLAAGKYLEKKAAYNLAMSTILQQPLEIATDKMKTLHSELYNKVYNGTATALETAQYQQLLSKYLSEARYQYASDYYALYGGRTKDPKKQHGVAEKLPKTSLVSSGPWWEDYPASYDKQGGKLEFIKSLRR